MLLWWRLTIRVSISFLRQKARAQKARKMGLSGLSTSFPHINFAHLISCCLTDGCSISFLRHKARAQKASKLGLLELSASFLYMNFALLMRRNYVIIQVQTVAFHRGEKTRLMHVVSSKKPREKIPWLFAVKRGTVSCFFHGKWTPPNI